MALIICYLDTHTHTHNTITKKAQGIPESIGCQGDLYRRPVHLIKKNISTEKNQESCN